MVASASIAGCCRTKLGDGWSGDGMLCGCGQSDGMSIPFPNDNNSTKGAFFSYSSSTPSVTKKAPKKRPSRAAKKTVSYCDTCDSDMQSDEDGDEVSKKRRFNKIANTEPVLQHLIADLGHHHKVHCTVRFSNSNGNGPKVFEAAVNARCIAPSGSATAMEMAPRSLRPL